jgi:hypothetical protein
MDRTKVPTQEEVNAAKTAWEIATTDSEKRRAATLYRQLQARRLRETLG